MAGFRKLNKVQIKAIADLLLEMGKWLLLSIVFSSLLAGSSVMIGIREIIIALILSFILIIIAVWLLKEVKEE